MPGENKRETGARALKEDPTYRHPNPLDTGDKGDEPKKPYGLTRKVNEVNAKTHQSDGQQPKEVAGQLAKTQADGDNNGVSSAEPRAISKDEGGDATFPLKQSTGKQ